MASNRFAISALLCVLGSLLLVRSACALPANNGIYSITSSSRRASCRSFYLTAPSCKSTDRPVMQDIVSGVNLGWRFELVPGSSDKYYISSVGCRKYLSIQGCGGTTFVDLWGGAGINQQFQLVPTGRRDEYYFKAVARADACNEWMSIQGCDGNNLVDLWGATGGNQAFVVS